MKDPEPSAIHSVPPPPVEDRTETYRHPLHQYALEQGSAAPSESRIRSSVPSPPPSVQKQGGAVGHRRVLLAVASDSVMVALLPVLRVLDAAIVKVEDGAALEQALRERGDFDLVLSDSHLPGGTGLGILAGMRRFGHRTPFIIVQSIHERLVRVVVGGGTGGVLSTRVVNDLALIELAEGLLASNDAPSSSRRPSCLAKDASGSSF